MTPVLAQVDPALVSSFSPLLAGPASAVVVLVMVGAASYRLLTTALVPLASRAVDRHLGQIDELIKVQKTESKAITTTLSSIDRRLARLEGLTDSGVLTPASNPGALPPDRST